MKKRILIKEHEHDQVEYKHDGEITIYSCTKTEYRTYNLKRSILSNEKFTETKLDMFESLVFSNAYNQGYQDCFEENE